MSRSAWLATLVVIALIVVAGYYALNDRDNNTVVNNNVTQQQPENNTSEENTTTPPADNTPEPETYTVSMTGSAFSPTPLEIKKGDIVTFKNDGTTLVWPASAPHPTHTNYPEFDPLRGLEPGESWSFQFDKVGTWNYHDHLKPTYFGRIVVTE